MRCLLAISLALLLSAAAALSAAQSPSSSPASSPQVTFAKHVAPILQAKCQQCHRKDTFAPMSLVSYEEVRPWARAIKAKVAAREMPPFYIDKNVGIQEFSNDASLSDKEIDTILKWVDSGAPLGNPADMPPPRVFPNERSWQFGKYGEPDLVVQLPQDYMMPTTGPDHWPNIVVDPGLTEDRYLAGVQIIPTKGYRMIHHIRSGLVAPEGGARGDDGEGGMGRFLNEYAIGKGADLFPEDSGRLIKAGTKIGVSLHLHPIYGEAATTEKATPVNIALALKFHPKGFKPKHVVISDSGKYPGIDIRPGDPNARVDGYYILDKPTRLLSWQPHMHNRGKASCMLAIIPMRDAPSSDGLTSGQPGFETINCAKFTFNWHLNYIYADNAAPLLPAGTMLHTIQWFDNSAAQKTNTDPTAQVTRGNRTIDEMSGGWLSFYEMTEAEFQQELADRGAKNYSVPTPRSR
jgi:hypothetical protein